MKMCTKCRFLKPLGDFSFKNKKTGKLHSNCRTCQKVMKDSHYHRNKLSYISKARKHKDKYRVEWRNFKLSLKCFVCGENHPATLDFHHPEDTKENNVSTLVKNGVSWPKLVKEIEKCTVLCSNCHRKHHYVAVV